MEGQNLCDVIVMAFSIDIPHVCIIIIITG